MAFRLDAELHQPQRDYRVHTREPKNEKSHTRTHCRAARRSQHAVETQHRTPGQIVEQREPH
jgi:hypothetical protein